MNTDKLSETDKIGGEEYKTSYHPYLRNLAFRLSYEDLKNSVSWLQTIEIDPVPFGKHDSIHPSIYQTKALKVGPAEYKLKSASIKNKFER
ncbi:hypothetical protein [Paenibacillus xylanexedens]|uniref:hypothetical protein n=1 Tax=Paenibacillus xylanexedens TaxID=528191 RepID=UPI001C92DC30|nr:hypothetical protein [Paenibacillus xylanexedens]